MREQNGEQREPLRSHVNKERSPGALERGRARAGARAHDSCERYCVLFAAVLYSLGKSIKETNAERCSQQDLMLRCEIMHMRPPWALASHFWIWAPFWPPNPAVRVLSKHFWSACLRTRAANPCRAFTPGPRRQPLGLSFRWRDYQTRRQHRPRPRCRCKLGCPLATHCRRSTVRGLVQAVLPCVPSHQQRHLTLQSTAILFTQPWSLLPSRPCRWAAFLRSCLPTVSASPPCRGHDGRLHQHLSRVA